MSYAVGDEKTLVSRVNEVIDKLSKMGIQKEKILGYYGYENLSQITGEDYRTLIGVGTAIKEGHIKIDEVFEAENDGNSAMSASEKIKNLIHSKRTMNETG
jgi:hypothetical protein